MIYYSYLYKYIIYLNFFYNNNHIQLIEVFKNVKKYYKIQLNF